MSKHLWIVALVLSYAVGIHQSVAEEKAASRIFAEDNLVAWCIVPFDSQRRGPEERAAMLEKLGFKKFAYDYRAEHIPTFDAEIEALKRHHIELSAWWFPGVLNDEAKMTLAIFEKHHVTPQLWITGGGAATKSPEEQQQRVREEVARLRPIAEAAGRIGCKVALYNHGGWFGEPENQIAIIRELNLPNVGIVYNLHHGHDHLDRFPALLQLMKPYLLALNLNGMVPDGERKGQKILQLSQGDLDLGLLKIIRDSGYTGPIGILGHTMDDAELRLQDNLDGLHWLLPQLSGQPAGPKPKMRTPVAVAVEPTATRPGNNLPRLVPGKFGNALNTAAGGAIVEGKPEFKTFPLTVECWTKLDDKSPYNILVAQDLKSSGTHWELFSMAGTGHLTAYVPGFSPDHCHSQAMICDGKWHYVAMVMEPGRIRLFVDGRVCADQQQQRTEMASVPGGLALGSLVDQQIGCTGLLDEVRISSGVRIETDIPEKPFVADKSTIALWHLDEIVDQKRFDDVTKDHPATVAAADPKPVTDQPTAAASRKPKIEGHWGEDALGFRWTEADSRDDRFGMMDTGPFFSGSIVGAGGTVYKGIVVRVGEHRQASVCYDTELMRASAGWTGFVKFDAARYGIIVPPRIEGPVIFTTPQLGGWSRSDRFSTFRESSPYGGIPKEELHYEGMYRHDQRVVLKFTVGNPEPGAAPTWLLESPWLEERDGISAISRTLQIGPSKTSLRLLVGDDSSRACIVAGQTVAKLEAGAQQCQTLVVAPHDQPVAVKLLVAHAGLDDAAMTQLANASSPINDLNSLTGPGSLIWGEPLKTAGEVAANTEPLVVDTINLPFENRFHALMFCGGHDFLPDGRVFLSTLHGDVWLLDGVDDTLKEVSWRRFATGLFQPLGVKLVPSQGPGVLPGTHYDLYVVGRDQITRLHDRNGDGEADFYENFNNDAYVSLNGHEYVTCLETDRASNLYYVKGNCNSAIPHDGSLLRVSPDGKSLDVFATGFRNPNGLGIGPHDEITVAPQEGEWTPASAVFDVHQGGFYGGTMSHHQPTQPKDFERPLSWFPRLADNSGGGQVWVPPQHWGPLADQLLHLSYGQCKLRLMLREPLTGAGADGLSIALKRSPLVRVNGGSTELPLKFSSGVHRARFNPKDGHLYLAGLKGWVTSAANDGCFQRVRYTGQPLDVLLGMKTYRNGITLAFSRPLSRSEAENIDAYQIEAWNYHWSAAYGSPDLKLSAPGQVGRDTLEPKSVTLLDDQKSVFIELPDLKPADQVGFSYSLRALDGKPIENTAYLTINGILDQVMPESRLHRSQQDVERAELLARLVPGVDLQDESHIVAHQRMLVWNSAPDNRSKEPFAAVGYLKVPFTGEYRFSIDPPNSVASVRFEIDRQSLTINDSTVSVRLKKGLLPFRVQPKTWPEQRPLRVLWQSDQFPREPIPATVLFSDSAVGMSHEAEQLQTGRALFAKLKCAACHRLNDEQLAAVAFGTEFERLRSAPSLLGVGQRLSSRWLAEWIKHPQQLRPHATMPAISGLDEQSIQDIVAYLKSLPSQSDSPENIASSEGLELSERGGELFEKVGCIACHTFDATDPIPEWNRVSLRFVAAKFQPSQLDAYLRNPHRHHVGSAMPDFKLSESEINALAAYIRTNSKGEFNGDTLVTSGNASRGEKHFMEFRCVNCHQPADANITANANSTKLTLESGANVKSPFGNSNASGCLAQEPVSKGTCQYDFTDAERAALALFVKSSTKANSFTDAPRHGMLSRMISSLRCTACHARDASSALWPEIVSEEGSGNLTETVPPLTHVGDKLQGPWIAQLLKGDVRQKPRPWLKARMPAFPEYADLIATNLAAEHGVPFSDPRPTDFHSDDVELGRLLTLRDGGLDCHQCHGLGRQKPQGDVNTQIALGINFAMIRERLRPDFVTRQLFDPPRYDIGSRMPRFAPDLKTTAVKHLAKGDATTQFEALRQYLLSLDVPPDQE